MVSVCDLGTICDNSGVVVPLNTISPEATALRLRWIRAKDQDKVSRGRKGPMRKAVTLFQQVWAKLKGPRATGGTA